MDRRSGGRHLLQHSIKEAAWRHWDLARSPYRTDRTLNEALGYYLTSPQRHRLRFCLTLVDFPPFSPQAAEWPALAKYWVRHYFGRPEYERIGGKPLFIVFSPELMRSTFGGSAGVRRALALLRTTARAAGLPGVTMAVAATRRPSLPALLFRRATGLTRTTGKHQESTLS